MAIDLNPITWVCLVSIRWRRLVSAGTKPTWVTLKDQIYLSGALLEIGFAVNEFTTNEQPLGGSPYQIRPGSRGGNFFKQTEEGAQRLQWISNFTWPTHYWHGRHQFKIGTNLDRIGFRNRKIGDPYSFFREDGTLSPERRRLPEARTSTEITGGGRVRAGSLVTIRSLVAGTGTAIRTGIRPFGNR